MKLYYFVDKEGVRQGPLPLEDLQSYEITPNTKVWSKGMKNWQKAKDIPDFQHFFNHEPEVCQEQEKPDTKVAGKNLLHSAIAIQYGVSIDQETTDFIKDNCNSKLQIVKHIKDKYNIGLAEAKEITDEIFESGQVKIPATDNIPTNVPILNEATIAKKIDQNDKPSIILCILSILFPVVGIILYFTKKKTSPNSARTYLIVAVLTILVALMSNIL